MSTNVELEREVVLLSEIDVPEDLKDLIPNFLKRRQLEVLALNELLQEKDFKELEGYGHRIKGHGAGYGFNRISEFGIDIQAFASLQNEQKLKSVLFDYEKYIGLVVSKFKEY